MQCCDTLGSVPESSVLSKFVRGPNQAQYVSDTATHDDPSSSVVSAKDQSERRNTNCPDHRIHEKHLLLVRPQVKRLRKDNHICDHVHHQHRDRTRVQQSVGESNILYVKENRTQPCGETSYK